MCDIHHTVAGMNMLDMKVELDLSHMTHTEVELYLSHMTNMEVEHDLLLHLTNMMYMTNMSHMTHFVTFYNIHFSSHAQTSTYQFSTSGGWQR